MTTPAVSAATIDLTGGATRTARLRLGRLAPGERGITALTVRYRDAADATVSLFADAVAASARARRLRIGVFERRGGRLPCPVFTGTLADLAARAREGRGVGRWTARGDGAEHTVTYEVQWRLPDEPAESGEPAADASAELSVAVAAQTW
ncbi:hypothetical protein [Actinomadura atramentaria]|uniref:hypothetical protein n=1 Tax=Actinomadura atramentaria TaxID=1990 RepID=UPI000377D6C4|nr:hypothetical protein [Actinomadura atramentaria]